MVDSGAAFTTGEIPAGAEPDAAAWAKRSRGVPGVLRPAGCARGEGRQGRHDIHARRSCRNFTRAMLRWTVEACGDSGSSCRVYQTLKTYLNVRADAIAVRQNTFEQLPAFWVDYYCSLMVCPGSMMPHRGGRSVPFL